LNYLIALVTSGMVLSHRHDEVEDCHKGTNGIWIASEHETAETNIVVGCNMATVTLAKGDCAKVNICVIRAGRGLPFDSTRHFEAKSPRCTWTRKRPIMLK